VCDELCDEYNGYTREHDRRPLTVTLQWIGDTQTTTIGEQGWSGRTPLLDANGELLLLGGAALLHERWTEFVVHMFGDQYERFLDNLTIDIAVSADPPVPRESPSAALDTDRGVVVLFGGARTAFTVCAAGGTDPGGCFLDYDHSTDDQGNLFSWALYPSAADPFDDTWERAPDGTWTEVPFSDPEGDGQPPPMTGAWMAYDPLTARTLLHDGGALWTWSGASWALLATSDVEGDGEPPPPFGASTFDPVRDRLVVSAGDALWTFEGASFARLGASGGEQPNDGALLVHPGDRSLYLVDPDASVALWQLGAREWQPIPSTDPELDGDPARSALVAPFVGEGAVFAALDDAALWLWDGASWRQRAATLSPTPRALVHVDGALLAFGDDYAATFVPAADEWDYQSLDVAALGLGSTTQFSPPELRQVDVLPAGLALTFVHDAGTSVVLTDARAPPFGTLEAVTVAGFGFADCFGSRCALAGQLETCTGETGWFAPTPAVLALGGAVLLFGGGETSLSYTERNDVGPCTIPEFTEVDLRTLGAPGLLSANPGAAVADPENDARPTGAFTARSALDPASGDVWVLEGNTLWRATLGGDDVPAVALTADPRAAGIPLAQLTSIAVDVTGVAPSGVRLVRWNTITRTWDDAAPAGGPTFALDVDAAALASLWDDTRDPLRLAVRPVAEGPVSVTSAAVRARFVLP
jgi:hypothetical protein